jgi:hypothetical protein
MRCPNCGHYEVTTYKQYNINHRWQWIWLTLAFSWLIFPIIIFIIYIAAGYSQPDDQLICLHCKWQGWRTKEEIPASQQAFQDSRRGARGAVVVCIILAVIFGIIALASSIKSNIEQKLAAAAAATEQARPTPIPVYGYISVTGKVDKVEYVFNELSCPGGSPGCVFADPTIITFTITNRDTQAHKATVYFTINEQNPYWGNQENFADWEGEVQPGANQVRFEHWCGEVCSWTKFFYSGKDLIVLDSHVVIDEVDGVHVPKP